MDIPADAFYENGTQLQVWDYAYGNQNQIFYFHDTGEGWQISSHLTGKIIEVRDSRHDDCAPVAQWDKHDLACGRWDIIANYDGTVSFRNRESGLYLNVYGGGDARNGTKMIQYHDDGTYAMRFYLEFMTYQDVLSATFCRQLYIDDLEWTQFPQDIVGSNILNMTGWQNNSNNRYYYPTPGQTSILYSVEYLSPNTVANLLRDKSYKKNVWNEIAEAVAGEYAETKITNLLKRLGFNNIPGLGYAFGILQALLDSRDAEKWNNFVNAAKIDASGRCSGVIVYTYYDITRTSYEDYLKNGTTARGTFYRIYRVPRVEYKSWTGDNFYDVSSLPVQVTGGRWWYYFK